VSFETITHYDVFSALVPYLSILSLAKKFDSISLEFDAKRMQLHKKKGLREKLKKKNNKSTVKYEMMNNRFML
jgi:hypothetical protein